jgi:hypothetical protein
MEARLTAEADEMEIQHAKAQRLVDTAKSACVGSGLAKLRLGLLFLPAAPLFLPLLKMEINAPFLQKSGSWSITSIMGYLIDGLDFDVISGLAGTEVFGAAYGWFFAALVGLILVLAALLAGWLTCFLAASPKSFARGVAISSAGFTGTLLGVVATERFGIAMAALLPGMVRIQVGIGSFIVAVAFAAIFALDIIIKKRGGLPVRYKQCWIDGFRAEEVQTALAQGKTLHDLRAARAADANG